MPDRHVRRTGNDYAKAFLNLLPLGEAWPRHYDSLMVKVVTGLNQFWGFVDGRAADLLEIESDPRTTTELLPDWERNWGLPDPCYFGKQQTMSERRNALLLKMTLLGGQSREFFSQMAKMLGYEINITEYSPFMTGISRVGDTSAEEMAAGGQPGHMRWYIGMPEQRYYWSVHVGKPRLTWFRVGGGGGEVGVDPHLRIGLGKDDDCMINGWKPAHTEIVFDYSSLVLGGPMAGTP